MKRITNKICAVLLSGIFMVMTGVNVNAAEQEYPPAEAVFPEEKVLQIENQIKNTPIYNDKDAEGNFSLKNTRANKPAIKLLCYRIVPSDSIFHMEYIFHQHIKVL